jgi:glyoxylase-like metal-dependent hydrolase (beta-lactamase superfamily II)
MTPTADRTGSLDVRWNHGVPAWRRSREQPIQVHHFDEHTVLMRQSKTLNYEAPFLFLLFGEDRALLLDTGATEDAARFPLRETVDALVDAWLARHPRSGPEPYELVVAHSHAHHDHVAGDGQFAGRPATTVVGTDLDAVVAFFGFGLGWPTATVPFDLGGRELAILGSPGHHESAITVHDPRTGFLLTGDTVLPGRLYASDLAAFTASLDRMVEFAAGHTVTHVIGCHVEMTRRAGRDYPIGARHQPAERPPQLAPERLSAIRDAAVAAAGHPGVHPYEDFVLYAEPTDADAKRLLRRGTRHDRARRTLQRLLRTSPR